MGLRTWSTTPASNASLSGSAGVIHWEEGQAPSSVNDSARVMAAELRDWYEQAEWITVVETGSIVSQTVLSITGTATATFHIGRRVRLRGGSTTRYATITDQSFSGGGTQVTLSIDSGSLSASMSFISVGAMSGYAGSSSLPLISGAWTPAFAFGGGTTGITYTTRTGTWTRIGKMVHITGLLQLSNKGSSTGSATITGLPFTSITSTNILWVLGHRTDLVDHNVAGGYYYPIYTIGSNAASISIFEGGDNVATAAITDADFSNTTLIFLQGWYEAV